MGYLYRIRNWKKLFEKAQSREVIKTSWVPVPNSFEGRGFKRLMSRPDGIVIYGAWVLILEIASKCPERGELVRDDTPLTCDDFALMTGAPKEGFEKAIEVLSAPEIGWIEVADGEGVESASEHAGSTSQRDGSASQRSGNALQLQDRTLQDKSPASQGGENQALAALQPAGPDHPDNHKQELSGGHGPKTPPAASTDRYDGSTVWAAWVDLHRARGLNDPADLGPDIGAAKTLARLIPRERLSEILAAYLDDDDRWLEGRGHGLRDLQARLNNYLNESGGGNPDRMFALAADRHSAGLRTVKKKERSRELI